MNETELKGNDQDKPKVNIVLGFDRLLEPTFDLLGKELRAYVKNKIDSWKEQRQAQNIQQHVVKALKDNENRQQQIKPPRQTTLQDAIRLEEWMKGAENVDPNEPILGRIWQEILKQLLAGKGPDEYLIKKLKDLTPREAFLLLSLEKRGARGFRLYGGMYTVMDVFMPERIIEGKGMQDRLYLDMLHDKGLVRQNYVKDLLFPTFFTLMFIMFIDMFSRVYGKPLIGSEFPLTKTTVYVGLIVMGFISSFMVNGFGRYSLSHIGREIVKYAPDVDLVKLSRMDHHDESNDHKDSQQSPPTYPEGRADAPSGSAEA